MKFWRAVLIGALLWVLIFFEVSILMFGFKLSTGFTYYLIHYIFLALLTAIAALIYFRKTKATFGQGILLGIIFVITGIILDAVISIPLFIKDYSFFLNYYLFIGYLEGILICGLVGAIK